MTVRELLAVSIALTILLGVHTISTLAGYLMWVVVRRRLAHWPARSRVRFLFATQVAPLLIAVAAVGLFVVPSWWAYEPFPTAEGISLGLGLAAVVTAILVAVAATKIARSIVLMKRASGEWSKQATRVSIEGADLHCIEHPFPLLATVGILRPRIFVARQVLSALEPRELLAAVRHEIAHQIHRHNLKATFMLFARHLLPLLPSTPLERSFAAAAEEVADEEAVGDRADVALDLASALIKIGRLVPAGMTAAMAGASFAVDREHLLESRIRRLADVTDRPARSGRAGRTWRLLLITSLVAYVANAGHLFLATHRLIELIVAALS